MKSNFLPNVPNAAKLIYSLRHLDYNNLTALADLVDNSIDANASQVWVDVFPREKADVESESEVGKIVIADNGSGMSKKVLDEALRLGSDVEKNASYDLGYYGMGLVTASISMGTRLEVITQREGECYKSVQDLDVLYDENLFVKTLEPANADDNNIFVQCVVKKQEQYKIEANNPRLSGTVVIIDHIDNCQWRKINGLVENLSAHFGQIYRKFLKAGKVKIYVQGREVKVMDPIHDYEPTVLYEDEIKLEEGSIKLTIAELKDYGIAINKEKGLNIANQGFYVLRNNREILAGETLGIFSKHGDFNTLRIEFSYPGTLDTVLSSNFSKNRIVLNQSTRNKLETICNPFIKQVRVRARDRQKSNREVKEDFSEVEKYITQKSHLLKLPPVEVEERSSKSQKEHEQFRKDIEKHGPRLNIQKRKRISLDSLKAKFSTRAMEEKGPLYAVEQERDKVVVYWNSDHPFYRMFIERNADNPDILNPICFLVYCLGSAELIAKPDSDSEEILENIRFDVGRNLAVLLKQ